MNISRKEMDSLQGTVVANRDGVEEVLKEDVMELEVLNEESRN